MALRTKLMRDILLVTLQEGENQVQSGQQPEEIDTWISLSRARWEGLVQRLARALTTGMNIETTTDTEHKE